MASQLVSKSSPKRALVGMHSLSLNIPSGQNDKKYTGVVIMRLRLRLSMQTTF